MATAASGGLSAALLVLLLLLCAALPFAGARRRPKPASPSGQQQRQPPTEAVPAQGSGGEAAAVRHLFATPLYVADLSTTVDAAALASLALQGYGIVAGSPAVRQAMVDMKLATLGAYEGPPGGSEAHYARI